MNELLLGSFYLQKTRSGNLIGEFTNNLNPRIFSESADLIEALGDLSDFRGNYLSTWQEGTAIISNLSITNMGGPNNRKFLLIWTGITNDTVFQGEGFLVGELLIGHYIVEPTVN